jgi:sigma-B regulation protein RsbU (phosphoserine phosphatase)
MPEIDGLELLERFRTNPSTRDTPLIVLSGREEPLTKAHAFALGADDYLVKLPNRIEVIARIRHHSQGYIAYLRRNEVCRTLAVREQQLATEIAEAAAHVRSLLPAPIEVGPIQTDWRFDPSAKIGGDAFGYQWLDKQNFAIYLLDVSGHGVGASLLAVSVLNTLSNRTLPQTDFNDPAAVLRALNAVFSMERHGGRFFTIWYGVYNVTKRTLTFSSAGHPPGLMLNRSTTMKMRVVPLSTSGPPIGVTDELSFRNVSTTVTPRSQLLLYSDGVVELPIEGGGRLDQAAFHQFITETGAGRDLPDRILERCRCTRLHSPHTDDCSVISVEFAGTDARVP